jgi:hypothetical protein
MAITLRRGTRADAEVCGRICYDAFYGINTAHNFPPDFPSPEVSIGLLSMMLAHPGFYVVVAERDGAIAGSNAVGISQPLAGPLHEARFRSARAALLHTRPATASHHSRIRKACSDAG